MIPRNRIDWKSLCRPREPSPLPAAVIKLLSYFDDVEAAARTKEDFESRARELVDDAVRTELPDNFNELPMRRRRDLFERFLIVLHSRGVPESSLCRIVELATQSFYSGQSIVLASRSVITEDLQGGWMPD